MKKVLIITYYWPPAGGGGVQRWLKFTKYLPNHGIKPVVAIPDEPEYPIIDHTLEKDVPDIIEVIKIPIWEPYKLFRFLTSKEKGEKVNAGLLNSNKKKSLAEKISVWLRGNLLIPDARVFWIRPAAKKISKFLKKHPVDTIITTGPPHSVHLIGLRLKKKFKVKWLADFRDPWSEIDYLEEFNPGKLAMNHHIRLEGKVLKNADNVITVSNNWAEDLKRLGAPEVKVITNGFDTSDFKDFNYNSSSDKIVLLYSGMLNEFRNPEFLWEELGNLCKNNKEFAEAFQLKFFGTIDQGVFTYLDGVSHLSQRYSSGGYISHKELLKEYEKASVLLLIQNSTKNALGHIPGKVFEYMATGRPILAIADKASDIAKILKAENAGVVIDRNKKEEVNQVLSDFLISMLSKHESRDSKGIEVKYSREALTKQLVELI